MKSRIYYGEYSLIHWIYLMLKGNISLPEYQRSFVWKEGDVKRLIKSLQEGQFVPPVTIARKGSDNIILDGQQRLTSILLAYLEYIPQIEKFEEVNAIADDDDSPDDDDSADDEKNVTDNKVIKWTFEELTEKNNGQNPKDIAKNIRDRLRDDSRYKKFTNDQSITLDFENTCLGFSYIIPESEDQSETQKFFSTLFRNMNYLGMKLSPIESRRSLYYMDNDKTRFFEGKTEDGENVLDNIKINDKSIDFVRYLSILSQYSIHENHSIVLKGYSSYKSREGYYADYVSYIVALEQENNNTKFDGFDLNKIFPDNCLNDRFKSLYNFIVENKKNWGLSEKNSWDSIIDADYWLFGLIYIIIFEGKNISADKLDGLQEKIKGCIKAKRDDSLNNKNSYSKSPNRLGNLRERLGESIDIYKEYAV